MKNKQILKEAKRILQFEIKGIQSLSQNLNLRFCDLIKGILNTKGRVIVTGIGKSGHIANKISATLASTGTPSFFVHPAEAGHGDLGMITKGDCILALSNSGESSELYPIINYAKRYNVPLYSITSNANSLLYKKSTVGLTLKKVQEACPLNLAPTTSTSMMLVLGDAIAITLLNIKGFNQEDFKIFHPKGNIGKDLRKVSEIMHTGKELPLIKESALMDEALITMTKKSFGCLGIISSKRNLIGIITDGDLRRNMRSDIINKSVKRIMTKKPLTINENFLIGEALNLMNTRKVTSLFICNKNKPLGIIHIHDCLRITT
ncbi:MAG: Arabinose 5-phosphate isomerase KdsD [Alphaproteobacteria bacterium MarineAlpha5_Bin11]|nr:KpsF/GutQ family sugar-phosphate isomerase [Pelagibacteraceae bacterium]PPR43242.1 MAG: Arabinose 5-phosphate isomerase KdsD [Alphaproteobacteria bacterium MarineAlpha5_Bin11]PPR52169.1 MAG: Arabinose 5-phosphate isomerase KdsD [Alphaproteobacteria bacterium MarineAlpha5_Bin10]|tara:strand:+ start:498 stop:1454 length:957 start_codon:yes stop_codon:yes gene_type:complete